MATDDADHNNRSLWIDTEEFIVSLIIVLPAVAWWNGFIGFETTVIVYLVLLTMSVVHTANNVLKKV